MSSRERLKRTAQETIDATELVYGSLYNRGIDILQSKKYSFNNIYPLDQRSCPGFIDPATINVLNMDTLDAARRLWSDAIDCGWENPRPAVLNFANANRPGGGWKNGAMAQEEAICYRSTLGSSLYSNRAMYPLKRDEGIYTPRAVILRSSMRSGHQLLGHGYLSKDLAKFSAITMAAILEPKTKRVGRVGRVGNRFRTEHVFAKYTDRDLTKSKMRLALRMAAVNGHTMLVLGAFGCGVFRNPPSDIARCWLEVLREREFRGHWWKKINFAVYDPRDQGNFRIFRNILHGQRV